VNVAILGAGGHGHDIAGIARALGHTVLWFDDQDDWRTTNTVGDLPYVVGVNNPAVRRRLAVGVSPVTLVHPTATIDPSTILEAGCVVGAGTHIGPDCYLGRHTHVGPGCTLTRTNVGEFVTISPGVDIAGDVLVGNDVLIGVGASVANLVGVGHDAVVGAGAVVVRDVRAGETVVCRDLTATGSQP